MRAGKPPPNFALRLKFGRSNSERWKIVAALATSVFVLFVLSQGPGPSSPAPIEGAFRLVSQNGEVVDSRALRRRPYAVFFGFTHCPGACSTMLMQMSELLRELGPAAAGFKVYFISLDPQRDTQAVLTEFVASFGTAVVGLTGSKVEIAGAAKSFHAYYRVVPIEDGDYVIDHSVAVYLVDARGRSVAFIAPDERHDAALKKLRSLVEGSLVNLSPFRLFDLSARRTRRAFLLDQSVAGRWPRIPTASVRLNGRRISWRSLCDNMPRDDERGLLDPSGAQSYRRCSQCKAVRFENRGSQSFAR